MPQHSALRPKDQFYEALDEAISRISSTEGMYLLGDLNARVGADSEAWRSCLGLHGIGKMKENWSETARTVLVP